MEARQQTFVNETYQRIEQLCRLSMDGSSKTGHNAKISDDDVEEIAQCLRDLNNDDASERPRTYAVLHMMRRQDLLPFFVNAGLRDNSLPYPNRRSLPPRIRKYEPEDGHRFLELQNHVLSPALELEKVGESPHVSVQSGDLFFQSLHKLGKGGDA